MRAGGGQQPDRGGRRVDPVRGCDRRLPGRHARAEGDGADAVGVLDRPAAGLDRAGRAGLRGRRWHRRRLLVLQRLLGGGHGRRLVVLAQVERRLRRRAGDTRGVSRRRPLRPPPRPVRAARPDAVLGRPVGGRVLRVERAGGHLRRRRADLAGAAAVPDLRQPAVLAVRRRPLRARPARAPGLAVQERHPLGAGRHDSDRDHPVGVGRRRAGRLRPPLRGRRDGASDPAGRPARERRHRRGRLRADHGRSHRHRPGGQRGGGAGDGGAGRAAVIGLRHRGRGGRLGRDAGQRQPAAAWPGQAPGADPALHARLPAPGTAHGRMPGGGAGSCTPPPPRAPGTSACSRPALAAGAAYLALLPVGLPARERTVLYRSTRRITNLGPR